MFHHRKKVAKIIYLTDSDKILTMVKAGSTIHRMAYVAKKWRLNTEHAAAADPVKVSRQKLIQ